MAQEALNTTEGTVKALEFIRSGSLQGATLRLYVNDYTPVPGSELSDFTEASFFGVCCGDDK